MGEWADIFVRNVDDRMNLQSKALFFIPSARPILKTQDITSSVLHSHSTHLKGSKSGARFAGRKALSAVMACKPVVFDSALGFIAVANDLLESRGRPERFTSRMIIACVFEVVEFASIATKLETSAASIAGACGIPQRIVESALSHHRVQYVHGEAIRAHLSALYSAKFPGKPNPLADALQALSTKVFSSGRASVGKTDLKLNLRRGRNDDSNEELYVYEREDLTPAPTAGHFWALE